MATYANGTKNSSSFTNGTKNVGGKIWDEALETWDEAGTEEWNIQFLTPQKSNSTFVNGTKN